MDSLVSNIKTFLGAYFFTVNYLQSIVFEKCSKRLIGRVTTTYADIAPTGRKEKGVMRNAKLTPCCNRGKFGVTVEEIWGSPAGRFFRVPMMTVLGFWLVGTVRMMRSMCPMVACPSCLTIDYVLNIVHCTSSNRRQHSHHIGGDVLSFRSAYAATPLCYPLFLSAVIHCLRTFGSPSFNVILVYRIVPFSVFIKRIPSLFVE